MPPASHAAPSASSLTVTSPAPEGSTRNTHRSYSVRTGRRAPLSVPPDTDTLLRIRWFRLNDSVPSNTASLNTRSSVKTLAPSWADGTFSNDAVSVASASVRPEAAADQSPAPSAFDARTRTS